MWTSPWRSRVSFITSSWESFIYLLTSPVRFSCSRLQTSTFSHSPPATGSLPWGCWPVTTALTSELEWERRTTAKLKTDGRGKTPRGSGIVPGSRGVVTSRGDNRGGMREFPPWRGQDSAFTKWSRTQSEKGKISLVTACLLLSFRIIQQLVNGIIAPTGMPNIGVGPWWVSGTEHTLFFQGKPASCFLTVLMFNHLKGCSSFKSYGLCLGC